MEQGITLDTVNATVTRMEGERARAAKRLFRADVNYLSHCLVCLATAIVAAPALILMGEGGALLCMRFRLGCEASLDRRKVEMLAASKEHMEASIRLMKAKVVQAVLTHQDRGGTRPSMEALADL